MYYVMTNLVIEGVSFVGRGGGRLVGSGFRIFGLAFVCHVGDITAISVNCISHPLEPAVGKSDLQ